MSTNLIKNDNNTATVSVVLDGENWKKAQNKAIAKASNNMNIKGFRKGKVPAGMIRKMLGKQGVLELAVDEAAQAALIEAFNKYEKELKELDIYDRPELDVADLNEDSATLNFVFSLAPQVELKKWENLGLAKEEVNVTDANVDEVINQLLSKDAEQTLVEDGSAAQKGDTVSIDFAGQVDGEDIPGGSAKEYSLKLGSNTFIPGFEDQLIDTKAGEQKEFKVTFPEDYGNTDLAGKEAVFNVTVNDIYRPVQPELNDEFAAAQESYGKPETVAALREAVKKDLVEKEENRVRDEFYSAVMNEIRKDVQIDVPEAMIKEEVDGMIRMQAAQVAQMGVKLADYLNLVGMTEADLRTAMHDEAKEAVASKMILKAIARQRNLTINDEELEASLADYAKQAGVAVEEIAKTIDKEALRESLLFDKAVETLIEAQNKAA